MSTVLVTGGTGFIGRPTVEQLVLDGHQVHVAARRPGTVHGATYHQADLLDAAETRRLLDVVAPSHVLHLAWFATPGVFWNAVPENLLWLEAGVRLLRMLHDAGGVRFVGVGTAAEREPTTVYAVAKGSLAGVVKALHGHRISTAWVRVFQPYGPGEPEERMIPAAAAHFCRGEDLEATDGDQVRDFIHVADVAGALVAVLESGEGGTFEAGTGTGTTVRTVVERIAALAATDGRPRFGARPRAADEPPELVADVAMVAALGWRPQVSLDEGLAAVVQTARAGG